MMNKGGIIGISIIGVITMAAGVGVLVFMYKDSIKKEDKPTISTDKEYKSAYVPREYTKEEEENFDKQKEILLMKAIKSHLNEDILPEKIRKQKQKQIIEQINSRQNEHDKNIPQTDVAANNKETETNSNNNFEITKNIFDNKQYNPNKISHRGLHSGGKSSRKKRKSRRNTKRK